MQMSRIRTEIRFGQSKMTPPIRLCHAWLKANWSGRLLDRTGCRFGCGSFASVGAARWRRFHPNGTKRFITNAPEAGLFTVMARSNPKEAGRQRHHRLLVEAGTAGVRLGKTDRKLGHHGSHTSDVIFEDVRVPKSAIIGGHEGKGFTTAMKVLDRGRLHIAAACCGAAERLIEMMLDYAVRSRAVRQANRRAPTGAGPDC